MNHLSAQVAERVRSRLRAEGVDPSVDPDAAWRITRSEVRRHDDLALARGDALIEDEAACMREVLASLSGFGALQPLLDDPEIEGIRPMHRGFRLTPARPTDGCPGGV